MRHSREAVDRAGKKLADPSSGVKFPGRLLLPDKGRAHLDDAQQAIDRAAADKRHSDRVAAQLAAGRAHRRPPSARFQITRRVNAGTAHPGDLGYLALAELADAG